MLQDDFYELLKLEPAGDDVFQARLKLNSQHDIFNGHFPGNPVVPGVCLIQITKELVSKIAERALILKEAGNIKFLAVINPEEHDILDMALEISYLDDQIKVKNTVNFGDTVCFKFGGRFSER